jgi:hypothetical protein
VRESLLGARLVVVPLKRSSICSDHRLFIPLSFLPVINSSPRYRPSVILGGATQPPEKFQSCRAAGFSTAGNFLASAHPSDRLAAVMHVSGEGASQHRRRAMRRHAAGRLSPSRANGCPSSTLPPSLAGGGLVGGLARASTVRGWNGSRLQYGSGRSRGVAEFFLLPPGPCVRLDVVTHWRNASRLSSRRHVRRFESRAAVFFIAGPQILSPAVHAQLILAR